MCVVCPHPNLLPVISSIITEAVVIYWGKSFPTEWNYLSWNANNRRTAMLLEVNLTTKRGSRILHNCNAVVFVLLHYPYHCANQGHYWTKLSVGNCHTLVYFRSFRTISWNNVLWLGFLLITLPQLLVTTVVCNPRQLVATVKTNYNLSVSRLLG